MGCTQMLIDDANDTDIDNDNTTRWTEDDCIGSLPNDPKKHMNITTIYVQTRIINIKFAKDSPNPEILDSPWPAVIDTK